MTKQNQSGFTALALVLILVMLIGVVGAGWYVMNQNKAKETNKTSPTQQSSKKQDALEQPADETAEWREVKSTNSLFSLRIPDGWKVYNYQSADIVMGFDENITHTKGTPASIINEDAPGRDGGIGFVVQRPAVKPAYAVDSKVERTDFTRNDGTKGIRYYEVYKRSGDEAVGPADGELLYEFVFFEKDGIVSQVSYSVLPPAVNQIDLVEKTIKTLKFL